MGSSGLWGRMLREGARRTSRLTQSAPGTGRLSVGFTLIEILVVIVVIAVLASIVAPNVFTHVGEAKNVTARSQIEMLGAALDGYRLDNGRYPTTAEGLDALVAAPSGATRWNGPYLQGAIPADPWGTKYQYQAPGPNGRDYEILSYGRDRAPGGTGDDADISM